MTAERRFAIGAGGTAGHVVPALVVAGALRHHGIPSSDIVFLGGHGFESDAVARAGYRLVSFPVRGIRRPIAHPGNIAVGARLVTSSWRAMRLLRRERVGAVFSMGGYAGVPAAMGATLARRRLVLFEPNAVAGRANRACARAADAVAVPFPGFGAPLKKVVVTGPLIRPEIVAPLDRATARRRVAVGEGGQVLGVFGGSQGARRLNESVLGCYDRWRKLPLTVLHVTGATHAAGVSARLESLRGKGDVVEWHVSGYMDDMAAFYRACDVIVSRAGAGTVAELLATATPAVLVPGAFAEGHQAANARVAVQAGAAVMVTDADASAARLSTEVERLLDDGSQRDVMRAAAASVVRDPAAGAHRVADLLLEGEP